MSSVRLSVILVLAALFVIPVGCEEEPIPRVDDVESATSPVQLSDWMKQLKAIFRSTNKTGQEASRILAYSSIAYYEGYAFSSEDMRSLTGQLVGLDELPGPSTGLSYNYGVVAEAAMTAVLLHMFEDAPSNIRTVITSTYATHERQYEILGVVQPIVDRSRALGELIGGVIISWSEGDGFAQVNNCDIEIPEGDQFWSPTPPSFQAARFPCWSELRPFTFASSDAFPGLCPPNSPPAISTEVGSEYMQDVDELIQFNANLNPEQEAIARFWSDAAGTYTVPGHHISILQQLIEQNDFTGKQTVTSWAQLCIAMADVYIAAHYWKYERNRPRPITFIRNQGDMNWESYVVNPATPEFPSIRSAQAHAAAQVFTHLFGNLSFTDNSHSILNLQPRSYSSFNEMASEAVYSRLYAGTNYRSTLENSEYLGRCIAQRANELFLTQ